MPATKGHGNPIWTIDETILALELYLELDGRGIPSETDARVLALSTLLRSLPTHPQNARKDSFRNPASVSFKLENIKSVATGKGLGNTSQTDRLVWTRFGAQRNEVKLIAASIRDAGRLIGDRVPVDDDEDIEFIEGRLLYRQHRYRERNPSLRKKVIQKRKFSRAGLACEACDIRPLSDQNSFSEAIFEVHHLLGLRRTEGTVSDKEVAVLCANCHRMIHRASAARSTWLSIEDFKTVLRLDKEAARIEVTRQALVKL